MRHGVTHGAHVSTSIQHGIIQRDRGTSTFNIVIIKFLLQYVHKVLNPQTRGAYWFSRNFFVVFFSSSFCFFIRLLVLYLSFARDRLSLALKY